MCWSVTNKQINKKFKKHSRDGRHDLLLLVDEGLDEGLSEDFVGEEEDGWVEGAWDLGSHVGDDLDGDGDVVVVQTDPGHHGERGPAQEEGEHHQDGDLLHKGKILRHDRFIQNKAIEYIEF